MKFPERYNKADTWWEKVLIMEIYHLAMCEQNENWTLAKTAVDFNVSIGLVSENLRLAREMHKREDLINCLSRMKALQKLNEP